MLEGPAVRTRLGTRLAGAVSLGLLLFGVVAGAVTFLQEYQRAVDTASEAQQKMVRVVQVQAEIAAFTANREIAADVLDGVLTDDAIAAARIDGTDLFSLVRKRSPEVPADRLSATEYRLFSPVDRGVQIGNLQVVSDNAVIRERAFANARRAAAMLLLQVVFAGVLMAWAFHHVVGRPLNRLAATLRRIEPGDGTRVPLEEHHTGDEIGFLIKNTNQLLGAVEFSLAEERQLRQRQEVDARKYQDLFDNAGSGIFITGRNSRLSSYNRAFADLIWLQPAPDGTPPRLIDDIVWHAPEKVQALLDRALAPTTTEGGVQDECLLIGPHGDERWLNMVLVALGDGSIQGTVTDVTERKLDELRARKAALSDPLTRLANREGLYRQFDGIEPTDPPFALAALDVADFRRINEAFNYAVGDQVLLAIAERLQRAVRARDTVVRVGADIFAVVMQGEEDTHHIGGRIDALRGLVGRPIDIEIDGRNEQISIDTTLGVALFPRDGGSIDELLRNAELALYNARGSDPRPFRFYEPSMQTMVENQRRLEDDLRSALAARGLELYFQPIVDLAGRRLAGAEALMRWQDSQRGFVPPDVFIPLAESLGLIGDLGLFVLEESCRHVAAWRQGGLPMYVSVNVSAQQIPDRLSPELVAGALVRHNIPAEALVLEITEGVLMTDVSAAKHWLDAIRALGVRVFLDDFGTGYSSLSYLKRFTMDAVKIDKSFVRDLAVSASDRALVEAIINMARSLGLRVVAEGIEDADQLGILQQLQCAYGQGYHYSRPVPAGQFHLAAQTLTSQLGSGN